MVLLVAIATIAGHSVSAQLAPAEPPEPLVSLKTARVPEPPNLSEFVENKSAAIQLGKALFWDMQVGSDGVQSCATCHFHAGADNRIKNQISPALLRVNANGTANPSITFDVGGAPNYTLKPEDFPFHKLADPDDRKSQVLSDTSNIAGSQGLVSAEFLGIVPGQAEDDVQITPDPVFNVNGVNVRQVTARNSPSVINAVFNFRNFWDGRAQNEFNGINPFGARDKNAYVLKAPSRRSTLEKVQLSIKNASLASQAVGPPLSSVEESASNRTFPDIGQKFNRKKSAELPREKGRKLLRLRPLGKQIVHPDDSVLGRLSNFPRPGVRTTYEALIKEAFKPEWWDSNQVIRVGATGTRTFRRGDGPLGSDEYTLMEYNFSLFMGLAVQLYEATLISDESPFDRYAEGRNNALTAKQKKGLELFEGKAKCINCHNGPTFSNATVKNVRNERLERMIMGNNEEAVYDNGFYNIGVRPTNEDLGVGGSDPFGNPLSESRLAQQGKFKQVLEASPNISVGANERVAANGAFKTPGLRNIDMTAPYFHNGGTLTLRQVVEFYNRGGDFHENNIADLDADIQNLNLTDKEIDAIVAFMESLTDDRVRYRRAPFDHPQLFIPNGHPGNQAGVVNDGTGKATDAFIEIAAVGRNGGAPLPNFLGLTSSASQSNNAPAANRANTNPFTGNVTQNDCPPGTTLKIITGGYACMK